MFKTSLVHLLTRLTEPCLYPGWPVPGSVLELQLQGAGQPGPRHQDHRRLQARPGRPHPRPQQARPSHLPLPRPGAGRTLRPLQVSREISRGIYRVISTLLHIADPRTCITTPCPWAAVCSWWWASLSTCWNSSSGSTIFVFMFMCHASCFTKYWIRIPNSSAQYYWSLNVSLACQLKYIG